MMPFGTGMSCTGSPSNFGPRIAANGNAGCMQQFWDGHLESADISVQYSHPHCAPTTPLFMPTAVSPTPGAEVAISSATPLPNLVAATARLRLIIVDPCWSLETIRDVPKCLLTSFRIIHANKGRLLRPPTRSYRKEAVQ